MSIITYTARRELAPGTTELQLVTRNFRFTSHPLMRRAKTRRNISLSGAVESLLFRSEKHYRLQSGLIEPRSLVESHILEFMASVENAEPFDFDRYGTVAQPDNVVSCIMVSQSFAQAEKGQKFHKYGFVIRES